MPEFSPGLEGVVAAETEISEVDGQNGRLIYRGGYLIQDLAATCTFEEVAFLLWNGKLPDRAELEQLKRDLAGQRALSEAGRATLEAAPTDSDPMDVLRTVLSAEAQKPALTKPNLQEAMQYSALLPTITAGFYRLQKGEEPVDPDPGLGHAANLLYMMFGEKPSADRAHWIDQYLLLLADHGLNASTFTTRVIASTGSDLGSALVGGIAALKGPAHGGAATGAMKMLEKIGSPDNA
jgi:citrate synthase